MVGCDSFNHVPFVVILFILPSRFFPTLAGLWEFLCSHSVACVLFG